MEIHKEASDCAWWKVSSSTKQTNKKPGQALLCILDMCEALGIIQYLVLNMSHLRVPVHILTCTIIGMSVVLL